MNKSDTQKYAQKLQNENKELTKKISECEEEHKKSLIYSLLQKEIDKIAIDIRQRQDNYMAMEFTRTIAELLRENGIVVHCTEHSYTKDLSEKSIEKVYGVVFNSIDCTEHDKEFTDKIEELEKENNELKIENSELHCEIQAMNAMPDSEYAKELEKKIDELESELSVKENLLKIKNGLRGEKPKIHIIGLREFGGEQYMRYSDVEELIRELEG